MQQTRTADADPAPWRTGDDAEPTALALQLAWSRAEPDRVGELCFAGRRGTLGREDGAFYRLRPGRRRATGPLRGPGISRRQLEVEPCGSGLAVRNLGRCGLRVDGADVDEAVVEPGGLVEIVDQALLWCTRTPVRLPELRAAEIDHPFGTPDRFGLVGEGPVSWALRDDLALVARLGGHVLVTGPSGAGKELAARTLHARSSRAEAAFVRRNAATLPEGLVDAELFGNLRNYPNPGTPERKGLVGEADGGTLFLDEIGALQADLQAHLLRVLDRDGEYQRLGESRVRHSDLRLIAATNRPPEALRFDLGARLKLRVEVPGLDARRCDVPLLIRHLLLRASSEEVVRERFCDEHGEPRVEPALVAALLRHSFSLHVRELEGLLYAAIVDARRDYIGLTPALQERLDGPREPAGDEPSAEVVTRALARHGGNVTAAARALGLRNRYALYRLMKKLEL